MKRAYSGDADDYSVYKRIKLSADNDVCGNENTVDSINNHIYFSAHVDTSSVNKLIKLIQTKNEEYTKMITEVKASIKTNEKFSLQATPNPLYLHISSFGGSILAVMSAIDAIKRSEIPIYTIVDGFAASAGTLMSIAGKKKYITRNSYMLIHQLSCGVFGQMKQIEDNFVNCKAWMDRIKDMYLQNTKLTKKMLDEQLKHDNWWDAETCIKHGLVEEYY